MAKLSSHVARAARLLLRADAAELFDARHYLERCPEAARSGKNPIGHYLRNWRTAPAPHWLFDAGYYLKTHPDVAAAGINPLIHFLRAGWREGRNPHPLFDTRFYLEQAPELRAGKLNPVRHYLEIGWHRGLQPHPLFDGRYYLATYGDVARAGIHPLEHYVKFGGREGRRPHPWFDPHFYLSRHPDVVGYDALQHYILAGAAEGREPHPSFDTHFYRAELGEALNGWSPLEHYARAGFAVNHPISVMDCVDRFLPVPSAPRLRPRGNRIDVIVPAYRGLDETRKCIESVLASRNAEPYELTVINDCSPEPELKAYLRSGAARGEFTLIENDSNLGFVGTVNRGMALHPGRDVVLLNSDATVANNWLDRLAQAAYRTPKTGTVTPLSNNATICSYPRFCEDNPLPADAAELDRICAEVNAGRSVEIPTAVGFCMYVRRDCLAQTGSFDEKTFGKGYCEENDFCVRAEALGWRSILAVDTFVYHAGGVSFQKERLLLQEKALQTLTARHPHYLASVAQHCRLDPAMPYRFAITAARFRASGKPVVLMVGPAGHKKIERHVRDLAVSAKGSAHVLLLQPAGEGMVSLSGCDPAEGLSIRLETGRHYGLLLSLLQSCGTSRVHIHHVSGFALDLEQLVHDLGCPMEFTAHDYYGVCPRIDMTDRKGRYCGEPDEAGCNECIRSTLPEDALDIASWRAKHAYLANTALRVITPSAGVAARMQRYFPAAESGKIAIAGLLSSFDSGQLQSTGYIRGLLPLTHPSVQEAVSFTASSPRGALRMKAGVLLVQRTSVPTMRLAEDLVKHCAANNIRIVYETDDDLFHIAEDHPDSDHYRALSEPAKLMLRHSAVVLVSTQALRGRLSDFHSAIRVVPNALDERLWFSATPPRARGGGQPVRILYMGSMTHSEDLRLVEEPLRELKREFGTAVELEVAGIVSDGRAGEWFRQFPVPFGSAASYPLFVRWLRENNRWNIGIAPLVATEFNRSKSFIKYLDYGALGIPGIYSPVGEFESVVRHGENGLLASDAGSWFEALRLLVKDAALRREMGRAAYDDVKRNHTLAAQSEWRSRIWRDIAHPPRHAAKAEAASM